MYYKVKKDSPLGHQFHAIYERIKAAKKATRKFMQEEMGIEGDLKYYLNQGTVAGQFAAIKFPENPDPKRWKKFLNDGSYMLREVKANEGLREKIGELPVVTHDDLNGLIDYPAGIYDTTFVRCFGCFSTESYFVLALSELVINNYKPKPDMEEITVSEYQVLKTQIDE